MADACPVPLPAASTAVANVVRHTAIVRATHWLTTLCFLALLVTGAEITISHPRFYWGETGNVHTPYLFKLPIPASRRSVPTGYGYVLHDQNGWSRSLHFEMAWLVVATGLLYLTAGLLTGHFRRNFVRSYNPLQRSTYRLVVFVLFPLAIWTGLAMSPAVVSAVPAIVTVLGGQQSARTIHFFVSLSLTVFLLGHIAMVWINGFRKLVGAMIRERS